MHKAPPALAAIRADTEALGFGMASDADTGALLKTLAASKPGGRLLEIGTGTGLATAWLLDGMDATSRLLTIENDAEPLKIARTHLRHDARLDIVCGDAAALLEGLDPATVDLIFADAWPGKFSHLDEALAAIKPGGLYVIDDLLPQPNWPNGHAPNVDALIAALAARTDLALARLDWSTGLIVAVKTA